MPRISKYQMIEKAPLGEFEGELVRVFPELKQLDLEGLTGRRLQVTRLYRTLVSHLFALAHPTPERYRAMVLLISSCQVVASSLIHPEPEAPPRGRRGRPPVADPVEDWSP